MEIGKEIKNREKEEVGWGRTGGEKRTRGLKIKQEVQEKNNKIRKKRGSRWEGEERVIIENT